MYVFLLFWLTEPRSDNNTFTYQFHGIPNCQGFHYPTWGSFHGAELMYCWLLCENLLLIDTYFPLQRRQFALSLQQT